MKEIFVSKKYSIFVPENEMNNIMNFINYLGKVTNAFFSGKELTKMTDLHSVWFLCKTNKIKSTNLRSNDYEISNE